MEGRPVRKVEDRYIVAPDTDADAFLLGTKKHLDALQAQHPEYFLFYIVNNLRDREIITMYSQDYCDYYGLHEFTDRVDLTMDTGAINQQFSEVKGGIDKLSAAVSRNESWLFRIFKYMFSNQRFEGADVIYSEPDPGVLPDEDLDPDKDFAAYTFYDRAGNPSATERNSKRLKWLEW